MQDRLEEFIKENRSQFDTKEPRHSVWEKIDKEVNETKVKTLSSGMWVWKAAVILLLAAVTFLMVDRYSVKPPNEIAEVTTLDQFKELETFYSSLISDKKSKIDSEISSDEFFIFLETDIEEIDAIYAELKKTFDEEQETPIVLNALVHLLRQKLHLLSSQLDAINEEKSEVNNRDISDVSSL